MARLSTGTWVLIADGEKALFLENEGTAQTPSLTVRRVKEQENPPTREQGSDRAGRFNDGPSVHRSAVDDTDWHQLAKDRFAADLADILYKMAHKRRFREIVLVAAPNTLGELRDRLHPEVAEKVIATVPKQLTKHPVGQIGRLVAKELAAE